MQDSIVFADVATGFGSVSNAAAQVIDDGNVIAQALREQQSTLADIRTVLVDLARQHAIDEAQASGEAKAVARRTEILMYISLLIGILQAYAAFNPPTNEVAPTPPAVTSPAPDQHNPVRELIERRVGPLDTHPGAAPTPQPEHHQRP